VPDRSGSTQRWPSQPRAGLDSLTSDAPCRLLAQPARVRSNQKARTASTTPSSKDAAFTLRSAFHRQVLLVPRLRRIRRARHRFSRRCRLRAGFRPIPLPSFEPLSGPRLRGSPSSALERLHHRVFRGCSPRTFGRSDDAACQLLQSPRFLSTTPDVTVTLRAWLGVTPRLCSFAQAALRLSTHCRSSCHWFRGRRSLFSADGTSRAEAGELCPDLDQPGHLMSQTRVHAGRRSRRDWDVSPRACRRTAQGHPRQGCIVQPSAKRVGLCAPEVPSIQWAAPKGWLAGTPQIVTNLWSNQPAVPF